MLDFHWSGSLECLSSRKDLNIWFNSIGPLKIHYTPEQKESILKKCKHDVERRNNEKGYTKWIFDEETCLMTYQERKLYGSLKQHDPNQPDIIYSEKYPGPFEPPPYDPNKTEEYNKVIELDPEYYRDIIPPELLRPKSSSNRSKRSTKYNIECKRYEWDIRENSEHCRAITSFIRKQGSCNNCWAVSTASVLTDRTCIMSSKYRWGIRRDLERVASARDLMECSQKEHTRCAHSAWPQDAWKYIVKFGTVNERCKPYPKRADFKDLVGWEKKCHNRCDNENDTDNGSLDLLKWGNSFDKISWHVDLSKNYWDIIKTFASTLYRAESFVHFSNKVGPEWENMWMEEIKANGSIVASYYIQDSFWDHDGSRIYKHTGPIMGQIGHAVRMIGFGHEECTGKDLINGKFMGPKYWLIANSFGPHRHDNGVFRIVRGEDNSLIESYGISWGNMIFPFD